MRNFCVVLALLFTASCGTANLGPLAQPQKWPAGTWAVQVEQIDAPYTWQIAPEGADYRVVVYRDGALTGRELLMHLSGSNFSLTDPQNDGKAAGGGTIGPNSLAGTLYLDFKELWPVEITGQME